MDVTKMKIYSLPVKINMRFWVNLSTKYATRRKKVLAYEAKYNT